MAEQTSARDKTGPPAPEDAPPAEGVARLWARIMEHRLIQTALAYFAAAIAIAHGEELASHAYHWPERVQQILIGALALGLPVTLGLVWLAGRKRVRAGRPPSRALDLIVLILLALLIVALIGERFFFGENQELSQILIIAIGALVLLLLADRLVFSRRASEASAIVAPLAAVAATAASDDRISLAVLPFANMSSDPEQDYFSDGLSEELMNQLAQLEKLRVTGRTSSFAFKGKTENFRVIGEKLGVAHVLEGSVRKAGNRLRITAQLIKCADGYHLWSDVYDRELDNVFAIQEDVAHAVTKALGVTLGVGETIAASGLTDDVGTYDLYLRARALFNRTRPEDFLRAAELYNEALARDPGFSRARAGLVYTYVYTTIYDPDRRAEAQEGLARTVAEALARAPGDWTTHLASALLHMLRYEWGAAEHAFERTVKLAPASVPEVIENWHLLLIQLGRIEDALEILQATKSSDPLSANRSWFFQYALGMLGRAEEAEAEYRRSVDLPGAEAREDIPHWALMRIWNGEDTKLIEARFDTYLSRQSIPTPWIAQVRAVYDKPDAALAVIRAAFDDPANQDPTRLQFVAAYAGHYGDVDLALAALRRASVDMRGLSVSVLWWPDLAGARRLPHFKDLVRDLGFVDYWRKTGKWSDFARPKGDDDFEIIK
jgi:TolB-like protein